MLESLEVKGSSDHTANTDWLNQPLPNPEGTFQNFELMYQFYLQAVDRIYAKASPIVHKTIEVSKSYTIAEFMKFFEFIHDSWKEVSTLNKIVLTGSLIVALIVLVLFYMYLNGGNVDSGTMEFIRENYANQ